MFHILSLYYTDDRVCSLHIFKPFLAPRGEADILWKVCSKNLSPVTKNQHSTGVKTKRKHRVFCEVSKSNKAFNSQSELMQLRLSSNTCSQLLRGDSLQPVQRQPFHQQSCLHQQLADARELMYVCALRLNETPSSDSDNPQTMTEKLLRKPCKWKILESHLKKPH